MYQQRIPQFAIKAVESSLNDLHFNLSKRSRGLAKSAAVRLVQTLGRLVNYNDVTSTERSNQHVPILCDRLVKFFPTRLRGFDRILHIMVSDHIRPNRLDYEQCKNYASELGLQHRFFILLNAGNTPALKRTAMEDKAKLVILDANDIAEIVNSENPRVIFNRLLSFQIDIDDIQPYDHIGEARGRMFFGRKKDLRRIVSRPERSFIIFGGRRIGKTSLLRRVQEQIQDRTNTVFISAQGVRQNMDICEKIVNGILGPSPDRRAIMAGSRLDQFYSFVKSAILSSGKRWTFLIDEIDDFIIHDRQHRNEVLATLRDLDSELREGCRFIFAGFRTSYQSLLNYYSPARNFIDPIILKPLDFESAKQLVIEPIEEELGYVFENKTIVDDILDFASYHPCHIQRFCSLLLNQVHSKNKHLITEQDVKDSISDSDFRTSILETFYWNTTPSQQLIVLSVLDRDSFTIDDVYSVLNSRNVKPMMSELLRDLTRLVIFGHFTKFKNNYRFTHKMLPNIIKEDEPVASITKGLLNDLRKLDRK